MTKERPHGPVFKRSQIIRLDRLMDMLYTPGEISEEIGMSRETIWSDYLDAGMPYKREKNRIWINGIEFKKWALEIHARNHQKLHELGEGEAFCFKCRKVVKVTDPKIIPFGKVATRIIGTCPDCGTRVNRAIKKLETVNG